MDLFWTNSQEIAFSQIEKNWYTLQLCSYDYLARDKVSQYRPESVELYKRKREIMIYISMCNEYEIKEGWYLVIYFFFRDY